MNSVVSRFAIIVAVLAVLLFGSAIGFSILEDLDFGDALYFTVVTLSTVGYGDIHPSTTGGKVLAAFTIIIGVTIFLTVTANAVRLLVQRGEERVRKQHLNMLVGVFFSEIGTGLLHLLSGVDPDLDRFRHELILDHACTKRDLDCLEERLGGHEYNIEAERMELKPLRDFLDEKGELLLRLYENQNLLEHESFTELLRAIFHLKEELLSRPQVLDLPETDLTHLAGDCTRAYGLLGKQWVSYMRYLRDSYPYLFSLALRTNPFSSEASAIVT